MFAFLEQTNVLIFRLKHLFQKGKRIMIFKLMIPAAEINGLDCPKGQYRTWIQETISEPTA